MTRHFFNFTEKFKRINLTERMRSESMHMGQLSTVREKLAPLELCTESASMSNRDIHSTTWQRLLCLVYGRNYNQAIRRR